MPAQVVSHDEEPAFKKRKVRKGTQSCWECKKRKVRCIWTLPSKTTCDNCTRRKTACISQEHPDEADFHSEKSSLGVEARLSRVEDLLERLINNNNNTSSDNPLNHTPEDDFPDTVQTSIPTPTSIFTPPLPSKHTSLFQTLISAWPTQPDLDLICNLPIGLSTHLHMNLCTPSATLLAQKPQTSSSPVDMLRLPLPDAHPMLFARKLLVLGSLLQGSISASRVPREQRDHFTEIKERAVDTADRVMLRDDELVACVEGVECMMMLAMIQNYDGKLHRAWVSARRAATFVQMLGLHRKTGRIVDPRGVDAQQLCYRIVEMDRYLSITLGLPQSSLESSALGDKEMALCAPVDRMARLQVIVAGRILSKPPSLRDVIELDKLLQESASLMPSQWWLVPDYSAGHSSLLDPTHEVSRTMYQFSFFHLVIRVHLPYMLCSETDGSSKATAVHASREILARYMAFRAWNPGHYYCRGVDFISFFALTVLCLAHIDSRNSKKGPGTTLAHSRPSDRATMERTLQILESMEDDATAEKLSKIMQHVLDVEAASAGGVEYNASTAESEDDGATECDGDFLDGNKDRLQLHIPYFGMINLQRRIVARSTGRTTMGEGHSADGDSAVDQGQQSLEWDNQWSQLGSSADFGELDDWTLQSVNQGLFSSLFSGVDGEDASHSIWPISNI
jgi:hypothetical protein